jgi:peptidyl-prolyl cis-trans isomerase SurA
MRENRTRSVSPEGLSALILITILIAFPFRGKTQVSEGKTLDQVVAVVGGEIVLRSDIQRNAGQSQRMSKQMKGYGGSSRCNVIERLMYRKLLLHQAKVDSVVVQGSRVDAEMDRRIRYFAKQLGSREKLEEFYGMSIDRIKEDFRPGIKERLRVQKMRREITSGISVTPSEVKRYYTQLPDDSIPLIDASVRMAHIVKEPELKDRAIRKTRERLKMYRKQIKSGEKSFSVLATLYSDDPASAENGGELGFVERGEMVKDFEGAVFSLDSGELSKVFRTERGFHLAQALERRGQKVKVRHILLKPEVGSKEVERVKKELDSIAKLIRLRDTLSFEDAARQFSEDDKTRKSGGLVVNRRSGSSSFEMDQLDPKVTFAIENMKVGGISKPIPYSTEEGKAFRIIKLLERTEPHKATLERDYRFLQKRTKQYKESKEMKEWVNERIDETYIRINDNFRSCDLQHRWLKGTSQ